jgi:hypothetical protein
MRIGHRSMVLSRSPLAACLTLAAVLTGCSTGTPALSATPSQAGQYPGWPGSGVVVGNPNFVPIVVSAELGTGHARVLLTAEDAARRSLASPDLSLQATFYDLAASVETPTATEAATFRWLIPDSKGIYVTYVDFPHAGDWGVEVSGHAANQEKVSGRVTFSVREQTSTPAIGSDAPPSDTPTAADAGALKAISTDQSPDLAFYRLSISDAIAARKPFVVVFASPALCTSGVCGPALEQVKQVAPTYDGRVNFIHVEPYQLTVADGEVQPKVDANGQRQLVPAVDEWGLPTEPYIFVVDAQGKVAAKFEGMAYPDELTAALEAVLS